MTDQDRLVALLRDAAILVESAGTKGVTVCTVLCDFLYEVQRHAPDCAVGRALAREPEA